ncbi:hypothetical protein ACGFX4_03255 [Kitasatospora sp. NPDC048365]|uniref:hypothetical protein n=1 Tax=Kitasatospora sp. NPDC048365 TaxID=3364050 RepID=UPI00372165A5
MDTHSGRVIDEQTELDGLLATSASEADAEPGLEALAADTLPDVGDYEDVILRSVN